MSMARRRRMRRMRAREKKTILNSAHFCLCRCGCCLCSVEALKMAVYVSKHSLWWHQRCGVAVEEGHVKKAIKGHAVPIESIFTPTLTFAQSCVACNRVSHIATRDISLFGSWLYHRVYREFEGALHRQTITANLVEHAGSQMQKESDIVFTLLARISRPNWWLNSQRPRQARSLLLSCRSDPPWRSR